MVVELVFDLFGTGLTAKTEYDFFILVSRKIVLFLKVNISLLEFYQSIFVSHQW